MKTETAKRMMDVFYTAKRIRDRMPPLPEGVKPSYINLLDAMEQISRKQEKIRISDVADFRKLPRPFVTRTIREMEERQLVRKVMDVSDHRVIFLYPTERGKVLYRKYVQEYFDELTERLSDVTDQEVEEMAAVIGKIETRLL